MNKSIIQQARQADLAGYLLSVGVPLIKNGNRYKHKEHDSLVFTENAYVWNSRQEHGNAIDYLVKYMGMDFKKAVLELMNIAPIANEKVKLFDLSSVCLCDNQDKVRNYLDKVRYIGYGVFDFLVKNKLLFQEVRTNNAFFPIYDENKAWVGAELQGITQKRFKGIKSGSKYGYGFNVRFSDDDIFDYALFFESAVDLLSFIDFKLYHEKKSLDKCILVSMSGLKVNIIKHTLKVFKGNMQAVLCVDNDNAGQEFIKEVQRMGIKYMLAMPDEKYKDWNEQVKNAKIDGTVIGRLIKRQQEDLNIKNT